MDKSKSSDVSSCLKRSKPKLKQCVFRCKTDFPQKPFLYAVKLLEVGVRSVVYSRRRKLKYRKNMSFVQPHEVSSVVKAPTAK